jgi:hypothetical protein
VVIVPVNLQVKIIVSELVDTGKEPTNKENDRQNKPNGVSL